MLYKDHCDEEQLELQEVSTKEKVKITVTKTRSTKKISFPFLKDDSKR